MNVKDGYLFPLVFEDSCDYRYTAYADDSTFRFVSNQSGEVWTNDSKFSFEQFKIYVKDGSWKILTPQFDHTSELEEALAKIDTLESALEDTVRELISLREGSNALLGTSLTPTSLHTSNNTAVVDVYTNGFKPVREMTMEDWEAAQSLGWLFETNVGSVDTVQKLDYIDPSYPVCFFELGWKTLEGFENYHEDSRTECDVNITRRIE